MDEDLPSVALASRLWHGLMLLVIGTVGAGAGYDAGPVAWSSASWSWPVATSV